MPLRKRMGHAIRSVGQRPDVVVEEKMVALMGTVLTGFAIVTAVMQEKSGLNLVDFATGVMSFSYAGMLGVFLCALFTGRGSARERRRGARRRPAGRPVAATLMRSAR